MNTTKAREVSMEEMAKSFEGKYVNVSCAHYYGIIIGISGGTVDYDDDCVPKFLITSKDANGNSKGTICIYKNIIERIEEEEGTYSIITSCMPKIEINECKFSKD